MKLASVLCFSAALGAIVYVGMTGIRWPILFASTMVVSGLVIALIARADRWPDDDR